MKVQLVVVRGKPEGKVIPLVGPNFKIGRGETCHLRPNSEQVSREHAEFTIERRFGDRPRPRQPQRDAGQRQGVDGRMSPEGPRPGPGRPVDFRRLDLRGACAQGGRGRGPGARRRSRRRPRPTTSPATRSTPGCSARTPAPPPRTRPSTAATRSRSPRSRTPRPPRAPAKPPSPPALVRQRRRVRAPARGGRGAGGRRRRDRRGPRGGPGGGESTTRSTTRARRGRGRRRGAGRGGGAPPRSSSTSPTRSTPPRRPRRSRPSRRGPAKPSFKDTSDAANDILRRLMERRRASKSADPGGSIGSACPQGQWAWRHAPCSRGARPGCEARPTMPTDWACRPGDPRDRLCVGPGSFMTDRDTASISLDDPARPPAAIAAAREGLLRLLDRIEGQVVGQRALLERLVVALLAGGPRPDRGRPRAWPRPGPSGRWRRPSTCRSVASSSPPTCSPPTSPGRRSTAPRPATFDVRPGPIVTSVLLADEINRAPAKVQSALLEAMQEGQITVGDETITLPETFWVLATQNPIEHEGTYPLPEAQLDRFLMKLVVGYPARDAELAMLELPSVSRGPRHELGARRPRRAADVRARRRRRRSGPWPRRSGSPRRSRSTSSTWSARPASRPPTGCRWPRCSSWRQPRATIALVRAARGHALLAGRDFVTPHDVKSLARDIMRHRILVSYEADAEGLSRRRPAPAHPRPHPGAVSVHGHPFRMLIPDSDIRNPNRPCLTPGRPPAPRTDDRRRSCERRLPSDGSVLSQAQYTPPPARDRR